MQSNSLTLNKFVIYQICIGLLWPFWSETGKKALAEVRTLAKVRISTAEYVSGSTQVNKG